VAAGRLSGAVTRVMGGSIVETAASRVSRSKIRVLAYHDVARPERFEAQMRHLRARYTPVSQAEIVGARGGGDPLPPRAVWVTFDDGDPTVVEAAQEILDALGIPATVFVCPGVLETSEPFWWDVIRTAEAMGIDLGLDAPRAGTQDAAGWLKQRPDAERRAHVARAGTLIAERLGHPLSVRQLTTAQLRRWCESGHDVGNHTWDHPCLDLCEPEERARQIEMAHSWLEENVGVTPSAFAYPNGNWATDVERTLERLGYRLGVGFDHRMAGLGEPALRMSRLRVSADADLPRFRSIVSGVHPAGYALSRRMRSGRTTDPRVRP
jgi:peptidoglycan/xylan/chitin deacetylase (PgdA/CDA1 family)